MPCCCQTIFFHKHRQGEKRERRCLPKAEVVTASDLGLLKEHPETGALTGAFPTVLWGRVSPHMCNQNYIHLSVMGQWSPAVPVCHSTHLSGMESACISTAEELDWTVGKTNKQKNMVHPCSENALKTPTPL